MATDLAPEFGRENVFQLKRAKQDSQRHALPATLGGRIAVGGLRYLEIARHMTAGWSVRSTELTDAFTLEDWSAQNPESVILAEAAPGRDLRLLSDDASPKATPGTHILALSPPRAKGKNAAAKEASSD